ncbi:MAG: phosphate signaling complex protein PhoU [Methylococcaceae bacterium]
MDTNKVVGHHISERFNQELEDIRNKVLAMGGLVERQIEQAVLAFTTGDVELAEEVIKQDNQVDAMEMALDLECSQIIALRQPTAFDLRLLIAVIKIVRELERAGDKAERIAQMAIKLTGSDNFRAYQHELEHISDLVKEMLHSALDAFARINIESITEITNRDENVNREYENIIRRLITRMMEDPRNITHALDIIWAARAMERLGDYACNICTHLIYMVNGEDLRHLSRQELEKKLSQ